MQRPTAPDARIRGRWDATRLAPPLRSSAGFLSHARTLSATRHLYVSWKVAVRTTVSPLSSKSVDCTVDSSRLQREHFGRCGRAETILRSKHVEHQYWQQAFVTTLPAHRSINFTTVRTHRAIFSHTVQRTQQQVPNILTGHGAPVSIGHDAVAVCGRAPHTNVVTSAFARSSTVVRWWIANLDSRSRLCTANGRWLPSAFRCRVRLRELARPRVRRAFREKRHRTQCPVPPRWALQNAL